MNRAMDYMEQHLTQEIHYEEIANLAGCSTYHGHPPMTFQIAHTRKKAKNTHKGRDSPPPYVTPFKEGAFTKK